MFRELEEITRRPPLFSHYTTPELWTDEHISEKMLEYHLNESVDICSRRTEFIERSVQWIVSEFELDETKSVADFGCGPGLYTTRLALSGAEITGIDFSERSLRYAREQTKRLGLDTTYHNANYLEFETDRQFDLIMMIMCDFCVLSPEQQRIMLEKWSRFLKPGGALLFDVYSLPGYEARKPRDEFKENLMDGFFSAEKYFGFVKTFKYDDEKVVLDKYTVIEETRTRVLYNWLQFYDREILKRTIEEAGLGVEEFLGDVAGAQFDAEGSEFAVVARKPQ